MSDFTTAARPYARAVFELARDAGDFAVWSEQLALIAAVTSDSEMRARYGRKKGSSPVSERGAPRAGVEEGREGIAAV